MLSRVTAKNVGDGFFETHCSVQFYMLSPLANRAEVIKCVCLCVCVDVRKYIRVLLVGHTDTHLRLFDWQLVTDSDDVMLVCLNNLQDHFVCHMFAHRAY